jgi:multiple sugar transport system substrate-binding protein
VYAGRFLLGFLETQKDATISYWGLWENETIIAPIIADFETQHPKIKVEYVKQSQRQYRERLQAAIARGEGPDVFRFHNTWIPMLKDDLAPVPETVMSPTQFSATYYPVASVDLVAGQTIYGVPLMIEGLGLYYNEDLFAAAGVSPPTTWEEMVTVVPQLTVRSENTIVTSAIALGTTGNVEHFSDIVATMMMQNGVNLLNPTGKFAEDTLLFYHGFAEPSNPLYTWNEAMDNSIAAFANGRVAMILAPSWRAFDIRALNPDVRFRVAPIPQLPGNAVSWASYWVEGVSAKSEFQDQAWEFLAYLTSREAATQLYTEEAKTRLFGEPYARIDLGTGLLDDPLVGAFVKQAPDARSFPLASRTFDNGLNDRLIKYLEDAINSLDQGTSPQEALTTVASGFAQVLGSYGLTSATTSR